MPRGRKKKPLQKQIAEGDPRKHGVNKLDAQLKATPQSSKGLPPCPEYLTGASQQAYNAWKQELEAMDMDRRPDAQALEAAAIAYGDMVEAHETLAAQGKIRMDDKGREYSNPAFQHLTAARKDLKAFCSEFGFTPVSRERLTIDRPDRGESDLAEILSRPRERKAPALQ